MNTISTIIYAISAAIGSLALLIEALIKLRASIVKMKADAASKFEPVPKKSKTFIFSLFWGVGSIILGTGGLFVLFLQQDGPVTKHVIAFLGLCLSNIIAGSLILTMEVVKNFSRSP